MLFILVSSPPPAAAQIIHWCWYNAQIPSVTSVCAAAWNAAAELSRMPLRLAQDVQGMAQGQHLAAHLGGSHTNPWAGSAHLEQPGSPGTWAHQNSQLPEHQQRPTLTLDYLNSSLFLTTCTQVRISVIKCTLRNKVNLIPCADLSGTTQDLKVQQNISIYK